MSETFEAFQVENASQIESILGQSTRKISFAQYIEMVDHDHTRIDGVVVYSPLADEPEEQYGYVTSWWYETCEYGYMVSVNTAGSGRYSPARSEFVLIK